ncbi:hypothetical protein HYPSUDRAFT_207028 [Hypholoma sublateritium FD-334 SS-4]|uniref:Uncharacterized protein n=1 Tax=Hypholoma sublateritium (strain FD-334 SS-4) TaxID=945553 RepID=A0A0D2LZS8_HYPSF|nr:hypothetical protein HYPSUDRAFT_207028 [Hypholoma sublateritium FD-334 SS-4]
MPSSSRHTSANLDAVTIPPPSSRSHSFPPTAAVPTEPFFIQSSIPKGVGGPHLRVIKHKKDCYTLPRSPQSPTLQKIPDPVARPLLRKDYALTTVSKIAVEPFRIASGRWSPAFPSQAERAMDPRQALAFDPTLKRASGFSQLRSLDLFPALGLAPGDFWPLFSRIWAVHSSHGWGYSLLGATGAEIAVDIINPAHYYFLHLLDAHNMGCESGVSEDVFQSIFHACEHCGRYVTQRMAYHHHDGDGDAEEGSDTGWPQECIYLRTESDAGGCLSAREYRRIHCPGPCKS